MLPCTTAHTTCLLPSLCTEVPWPAPDRLVSSDKLQCGHAGSKRHQPFPLIRVQSNPPPLSPSLYSLPCLSSRLKLPPSPHAWACCTDQHGSVFFFFFFFGLRESLLGHVRPLRAYGKLALCLPLHPMTSTSPPSVPSWATLSSGAASGLASCLLLQPMDLLKTRMQQQVSAERHMHEGRAAATAVAAKPTSGMASSTPPIRRGGPTTRTKRLVGVTTAVLRDDGWRGLWRGTVPTVARNVPGVALYFYSVSEIRALLAKSAVPHLSLPTSWTTSDFPTSPPSSSKASTLARLTVAGNLVSGAVARVSVGFLLSPFTVVKARFESSHFSKDAYPSLPRALAQIYQFEGVKGLFRGFSATAMRDAPYAGIYLASYEKAKEGLGKWGSAGGRGSGSSVVIGFSGEQERQSVLSNSGRGGWLTWLLLLSLFDRSVRGCPSYAAHPPV